MSKARVIVHESRTAEDARKAVLALLAMGMDAEAHRVEFHVLPPQDDAHETMDGRVHRSARTLWQVSVAEEEAAGAEAVVADFVTAPDAPLELAPLPAFAGAPAGGIWTLEHAAASLVIASACVAAHVALHGFETPAPRSAMISAGAVAPWMVREGQWWRLLSAVFLHFDYKHLVGNMGALLFLGPPLGASIGQLRVALLFVATGAIGNVVSQLFGNESAVKAGASGGICGLLGALAGVAIASMASATDSRQRRPAWQTLGALVALFGMMVGFEPGSDHYAHVGGLVSGLLLGRLFGVGIPSRSTDNVEAGAA